MIVMFVFLKKKFATPNQHSNSLFVSGTRSTILLKTQYGCDPRNDNPRR